MEDMNRLENKDGGPTLAPRKRPRLDDPEEYALVKSIYFPKDPPFDNEMAEERRRYQRGPQPNNAR